MDDTSQVKALLQINNLDYRIPPALSVAVSRSHAKYPLGQQVVSSSNNRSLIFSLPSGAQYVNLRNSFIKFTVTVNPAAADPPNTIRTFNNAHERAAGAQPTIGCPGVLALLKGMSYRHSTGTILDERNNSLGALAFQRAQWAFGNDWKKSVGSLFGYCNTTDSYTVPGLAPPAVDRVYPYHNFTNGGGRTVSPFFASSGPSKTYIIPLMLLSDIFGQDKLAPSFMVAGSRLQIDLETPTAAWITDPAAGTAGWTISQASIYLEQYQLTDAIAKTISSISATSGLEFPFVSWHAQSKNTPAANKQVTFQVSRSLSRANTVMWITRHTNDLENQFRNSVAPISFSLAQDANLRFNMQLGGQYIPIQPAEGALELFQHALIANGKYHSVLGTDLNYYRDWLNGGAGAIQFSLETSSTLEQSGSALSAQRVLVLNLERDLSTIEPLSQKNHLLFVSYVRLPTFYLDSVIVRS